MARSISSLTGLDALVADRTDAVQHTVGFVPTAKKVFKRFKVHNLTVVAAGIAFFLLLSMVPLMVAVVSGYSLALGTPQEAQTEIEDLTKDLSEDNQLFVQAQLEQVVEDNDGKGPIGLIIGIALALFSVSGAMQKLLYSISTAYQAVETRKGLVVRGMSYLFTVVLILLAVTTVAALGLVPWLLSRADLGSFAEIVINIGSVIGIVLIFVGAMTVLYRFGPDRQHRTPWKNRGAFAATGLFILFTIGLILFFRVAQLPPSYGLLGSVAVIMVFLQLVALAIVLGAEVNAVLENPANAKAPVVATVSTAVQAEPAGPRLTARGNPVGGPRVGGQALVAKQAVAGEPTGISADVDIDGVEMAAAASEGDNPKMLTFGKALAGLVALFALGRAGE